jgi:hypothetical protein
VRFFFDQDTDSFVASTQGARASRARGDDRDRLGGRLPGFRALTAYLKTSGNLARSLASASEAAAAPNISCTT